MHRTALKLVIQSPLTVAADALVVEDSGWLAGAKSLAAEVDARGGQPLRHERATLIAQQGPLAIGTAVCTTSGLWAELGGPPTLVHAATYTYPDAVRAPETRVGATPLDISRATLAALRSAAEAGATHVCMMPLGVRPNHHQLPANPKNLARYVMAGVQLAAIAQALPEFNVAQVTVALTERGYAIWQEVLGRPSW